MTNNLIEEEDNKKSGAVVSKTDQELSDALYWATNMLRDAQIPSWVMGITAKAIVDNQPLSSTMVEIGVSPKSITQDTKPIFQTICPELKLREGLMGQHPNGVWIYLYLVEGDLYTNLDTAIHGFDEYKIPNPFVKYWEAYK